MYQPSANPWWHHLPVVNASLNGVSALLLMSAFVMIKRRQITAHATLMLSALGTSAVFLACYLIYHVEKARHGGAITHFPASGWKPLYLTILITHILLAFAILPLIGASLYFAWRKSWKRHHQISSITFPAWLYVSVTGVVVYWMLYHLAPTLAHA